MCISFPPVVPDVLPTQQNFAQKPITKAFPTITASCTGAQYRITHQQKRHDNEVFKFKVNQCKRGYEKIKRMTLEPPDLVTHSIGMSGSLTVV